jgi:hypothetical protein
MMKANKVTVRFTIEALSIDVTAGLISQALTQVDAGYENGKLVADDGDQIEWETKRTEVAF